MPLQHAGDERHVVSKEIRRLSKTKKAGIAASLRQFLPAASTLIDPTTKWGLALLPAPNAPSEGYVGVRQLGGLRLLLLDPNSPAQASLRTVVVPGGTFSVFRGPSWADPPARRLLPEGNRVPHWKRPTLPAPLTGWSETILPSMPEDTFFRIIPSPAGGDRSFRPFLTFLSLPTVRGGGDFRPDHHVLMRSRPSRAKRKTRVLACG